MFCGTTHQQARGQLSAYAPSLPAASFTSHHTQKTLLASVHYYFAIDRSALSVVNSFFVFYLLLDTSLGHAFRLFRNTIVQSVLLGL